MRIFISYRRADDIASVMRLKGELERLLGDGNVFVDVDIPAGRDFPEHLSKALDRCDAFLALIGPNWQPERLASAEDFVRMELALALDRGIPLVPVLMQGARPPSWDMLPSQLSRLAQLQAIQLSEGTFRATVEALVHDLRGQNSSSLLIFLSSGGTCRDPMARAIAQHLIAERRPDLLDVRIEARALGEPSRGEASFAARRAIKNLLGADLLAGHRPQRITNAEKSEADLILVADRFLLQPKLLPSDKTYVLKPFLGLDGDIADPWPDGRDPQTLARYLATALEIRDALEAGLDRLAEVLAP